MNNPSNDYKIKVKKYLELENVSVLAGAGTSFHLGTPVIRTIPYDLKETCKAEITKYFKKDDSPSYEELFNCLQANRYLGERKGDDISDITKSIIKMQRWLFEKCNTEKTIINKEYQSDKKLKMDRYHYHETFIKKLLQRPNNLKRVNLFTTNYDMAFDYALDNLGVHYINGFMGVHNRCFRPEVYDYDLYFPGQTVSGKVHRAEKVLRYYKVHGSLSWISTTPSSSNTYGIKEISLDGDFTLDNDKELMVYPCASKKSYTLDLPYSELFRHFSKAIIQPQSVLFCIGYSFYDEHVNDIIKQALSIPSFTLIIINYAPTEKGKNPEIEMLRTIGDKRVIVLDETDKGISTFKGFVENVMPDLYEEEEHEFIADTMNKLYPGKEKKGGED